MDFHRWIRNQKRLNPNKATAINQAGHPISYAGEQTIRLLGPFRINYNSSNIGGGSPYGHVIAGSDIAAGAAIVRAWAVGVTNWVTTAPAEIEIGVAPLSDPTDAWTLQKYLEGAGVTTLGTQGSAAVNSELSPGAVDGAVFSFVGTVTEAARIYVRSPRTPTAGAVDVYALIAEPAH